MEPQASGGWQAAIDPSLAARLLRPAVRPGVSDPAHGPTLAARLQRMAAPTLADDVARRYGSTTLDADRPPVVYAAPPIRFPASTGSQRGTPDPSGTLRKGLDAGRPVVRGTVRATGPAFPPVRPLGNAPVQRMIDPAAPVQRMADPVAAAVPVAAARRTGIGTAGGASTGPRAAERSGPGHLVVAPAPTRLQRQIAAEHAESLPIATPALPRVQATRTADGGGAGRDARPAGATTGEGRAGSGSPAPARAGAATDVVQTRIDPAASHPPRVAGPPTEPQGMPPAPPPIVLAAPGGGSDTGPSADPAPLPVAIPAARGGEVMDGAPIQMIRAHPAEPWSPPRATGGIDGNGRPGARPVVAARSGSGSGGTVVQRMATGGDAGGAPGRVATRMVHAAPAVVVQRQTTTGPPAGGPPAELPTMTAGDAPRAQTGGGANTAEVAEQVYGLLLRRLQDERKQRGW